MDISIEDMQKAAKAAVAEAFNEQKAKAAADAQAKVAVEEAASKSANLEKQMADIAKSAADAAIAEAKAAASNTSKGESVRKYTYAQPFKVDENGRAEKGYEGINFVRYVKATLLGGGDPRRSLDVAKGWRNDTLVESFEKAIGTVGIGVDGGNIVPIAYNDEFVELLRPKVIIRDLGAIEMPMPRGNMTLNRQSVAGSASYTLEAAPIVATKLGVDNVTLTAKKLTNLMAISNELLNNPSISSERLLLNDILHSAAYMENLTFLRGLSGVPGTPTGLLGHVPLGNKIVSSGKTLTNVESDISTMLGHLEDADIPMDSAAWIMSPRSVRYLKTLRDLNGNHVYKRALNAAVPTIEGVRVYSTNIIPNVLGIGANESEMFLVDASSLIIGTKGDMRVDMFRDATWNDNGTIRSGVSEDTSTLRMITEHDFVPRYDGAEISYMSGVQYF